MRKPTPLCRQYRWVNQEEEVGDGDLGTGLVGVLTGVSITSRQ